MCDCCCWCSSQDAAECRESTHFQKWKWMKSHTQWKWATIKEIIFITINECLESGYRFINLLCSSYDKSKFGNTFVGIWIKILSFLLFDRHYKAWIYTHTANVCMLIHDK